MVRFLLKDPWLQKQAKDALYIILYIICGNLTYYNLNTTQFEVKFYIK